MSLRIRPLIQALELQKETYMKINYYLILLLVFLISGCSTPYQPFSVFSRGGYKEKQISQNTYQVDYYGNRATSKETLNTLLQYRSAEITLQNKYNYYVVLKAKRRVPGSVYGGFISTIQVIKMFKKKPKPKNNNTYNAKEVIQQFKSTIGDQK